MFTIIISYVKTGLLYIYVMIKKILKYSAIQMVVLSILLFFVLEMLSRRSIIKGLSFVITNPLMSLTNVLIILLTLSISLMFSRKRFFIILITFLWLSLGIINFVVMGFRTTPISFMDLYVVKYGKDIIHIYLNYFQIIIIVILTLMIVASLIFLWKRLQKTITQIKLSFCMISVTAVLIPLMISFSLELGALSKNFGNLAQSYSEYGFSYCFSVSIFDRGIKKPKDYSDKEIDNVIEEVEDDIVGVINDDGLNGETISYEGDFDANDGPNIVFVLLESFFDVNQLLYYSFSENPIPNFSRLKKEFSSGYLEVPSIGAGTANTEFEILTGMNTEHFGAGEYPYKTIMQKATSESIPYNLEELEYDSHAIHNNTGTFYDRHNILQRLGFDSFSSIEYMNDVEYNSIGWAKDNVLKNEIFKALDSTEKRDFVFTISVQPHGKYPETIDENQKIKAFVETEKRKSLVKNENGEKEIDNDQKNRVQYFVNQLSETDQFIGEVVEELTDFNEPTVVVFFGDHLPSLFFENEDLINDNNFETEYVIWSNFNMDKVDRDLTAYQLSSYVMQRLGVQNGVLTKFHQSYFDEPDYQEKLELLQYDMLYGDKKVFNREEPYSEKEMQMGILDIVITDVKLKGDVIFVEGENFTPWSVLYIDDKPKETLFVDENTLIVPYDDLTDEVLYVAQVTDNDIVLSKSKEWEAPK